MKLILIVCDFLLILKLPIDIATANLDDFVYFCSKLKYPSKK